MSDELTEAFKRTAALARQPINRTGWTPEQWAADAERIMDDIDGAASALLNGHIFGLIRTIKKLREEKAQAAAQALRDAANEAATRSAKFYQTMQALPNRPDTTADDVVRYGAYGAEAQTTAHRLRAAADKLAPKES